MSTAAPAAGREDLPAPGEEGDDLLRAVVALREAVAGTGLELAGVRIQTGRAEAESLLSQIDDYLLPRLRRLDAPLLAVVGGSTGAGKSTLVNSLLRSDVTTSGVLRPTTRQPVLVHAPADTAWFSSGELLPSLPRASGAAADARELRLVADDAMAPGLALLDAPDVDSVVEANRELARQLLAAADLWLFVTTASRYADAVPWTLLGEAIERGTSVAVILNRVPPGATTEVAADLARMLAEAGLRSTPLFAIGETTLVAGRLPEKPVAALRRWLETLNADARSRDVVVRRTLAGALISLRARVERLAAAADAQWEEVATLRSRAEAAYDAALDGVDRHLSDGTLLRGEVLTRWHEFVGTGEVFATIQAGIGRARDRVVAALTGRHAPEAELQAALVTGVAALVLDAAGTARERSLLEWNARSAGAALLAAASGSPAADPRLPASMTADVESLVRSWQGHVLDLVRREGGPRRSRALAYSLGVSGAGVVLMLTVFAATAGVTGAEAGIAAGTAALAQRVLQAAFGDQAVRALAREAREDLMTRITALLRREQEGLEQLLPRGAADVSDGQRLRAASARLEAVLSGVAP